MVDLEEFVASGDFGPVRAEASLSAIMEAFGEPDHVEPGRKARPTRALYGDVEFALRSDKLVGVSMSLESDRPVDAGTIPVRGWWPPSSRSFEAVARLLRSNDVSWRIDQVMSSIQPEESSQVWITAKNVHLGFFEGVLQRVGADYYMFV